MTLLAPLIGIVRSLLSLYLLILLVRVVFDWVTLFARQWRPRGITLVVANLVYALTDPPLRALGRVVPVLRLGGVGIDLSFLVLFIAVSVVSSLLGMVLTMAW